MQPPTELAVRFCLQNCVGLFVSQSSPAADNAFGKTRILCASAFIELNENRMGESIDIGIQTANAVAQSLRQHRDHAIRQINAVTAPPRFTIKRAVRSCVIRFASSMTLFGNAVGKSYFRTIDNMSMPGAVAAPSTSMISPSGFTCRDSHASRRTTTLSPRVGAFGSFSRGGT